LVTCSTTLVECDAVYQKVTGRLGMNKLQFQAAVDP